MWRISLKKKKYKIDHKRLEEVALGIRGGRGCGKTTLAIHELCSSIEFGRTSIIALVKVMHSYEGLYNMITQIIPARLGRKAKLVRAGQNHLIVMYKEREHHIYFTSYEIFKAKAGSILCGRDNCGFVNFVDH